MAANTAEWNREIYLSDVIGSMILDDIPFYSRMVKGYRDWGTIREWQRALLDRRAYLISLDGFVFERGNRYFNPRFEDVQRERAEREQQVAEWEHRQLARRHWTSSRRARSYLFDDCPDGLTVVC